MTDSIPTPTSPNAPGLPPGLTVQRRLALAWLALSWERLWSRLWVPATLLGVFVAIAMTDVLPSLHWVIHTLVVIAAAAGVGFVLWHRLKDFAWPTRGEARARLETTSPVEHRPLTTVEDSLAAGASAVQQWLWRMHQDRARDDLDRLRVKGPAPGIANRDRFATRAAVVLALFVAVVGSWGDIGNRIWRGVLPMFGGADSNLAVKVWITPPAYTSRSPIYLEVPASEGTQEPAFLDVPDGSKVLAVVTGTRRNTVLSQDEGATPLEKIADETQRGETDLKPSKRLEIRQTGRTLAGWDVNWIADMPPTINFAAPPSEAPRWRWRIDYRATDDYGLQNLTARVTRAADTAPDAAVLEFPVALPAVNGRTIMHSSIHDLAAHPWAGQKVNIQLTAIDQANQTAASKVVTATLPERTFIHPVAKELAKWRKEVAAKPQEAVAPTLDYVSRTLQQPNSFGGDHLVHLTLSTAKYRLAYEPTTDAAKTVPDLLWHAAVRIEDGSLVAAEARLAAAEEALREALERGASTEEINRLLDDLQQAVNDYAKALDEKSPDKDFAQGDTTTPEDIASSVEQLRQLSDVGAEDAAKQALSDLQQQLQNLRDEAQNGGNENPQVKKAQDMLDQMRKLTEEQSKLLDENFEQAKQQAERDQQEMKRQAEERAQGRNQRQQQSQADKENEKHAQANSAAGRKAADKQEALREQLNEIAEEMEKMSGKKPDGMSDADQAMSDARDSLNAGAFKPGVENQTKALSKLQESIASAQDQLAEALFERGLGGAMKLPGAGEMGFSKLGARDGRRSDGGVKVPTGPDTEGMAQRVRTILNEIRERASDRTRPEAEQDYLRRLMKQF
jgi:uncharacterized protein (TIGR02302 family)